MDKPYLPKAGSWVVVLEISREWEDRDLVGRCFQVKYDAWSWREEIGPHVCCHFSGIPLEQTGAICRVRPAEPHEEAAARLRDKP